VSSPPNIVSADEECSNLLVLGAGTEAAVGSVQTRPSSARSILLAISARLRAKGWVGTKTNVGTLLSRMGKDVNTVVNSQQDKVKEFEAELEHG
jgi:hypothetical protein